MRHRFFLLLFFCLAGFATIGIVFGAKAVSSPTRLEMLLSWQYAFVWIFVAIAIAGFFQRLRHRLLWESLFLITIFLGVWYVAILFLPLGVALLLVAAFTLVHVFARVVLIHDLFYLIGGAGVAINFAGLFSPEILVAGLVVFTIYDMVAGPPGGPIEALASFLVRKGIVPGLILPSRGKDFFASIDNAVRKNAALLGAGDLILPLTLVARAAFRDQVPSLLVLAGLLIGAGILVRQRSSMLHPRAALPPLAIGAAVPFLALRFFSLL